MTRRKHSDKKELQDSSPEGNPFKSLIELKKNLPIHHRKPQIEPAPPVMIKAPAPVTEPSEESLFKQAMSQVTPHKTKVLRIAPNPPPPDAWNIPELPNEETLALRELSDLINGRGEFDFSYTDEHIEAHVKGFPPDRLEDLRQGRIQYQYHLDIHGLTLIQAEEAITKFILDSIALNRFCVLIIHGRGLRSVNGIPVIKRNLEGLLLKPPLKKHILAFTTARPQDGGPGSSYILLRTKNTAK